MKQHPWLEKVFNPLIVSAMLGCVAIATIDLIHLFVPTWRGTYLIVCCVLAALEASYSRQLVRSRQLRGRTLQRFRLVEIGTILVMVKIGGYVGESWANIVAEIKTWPQDPLNNILDIETVVTAFLTLGSWLFATLTMRDLERIGDPWEQRGNLLPPGKAIVQRVFGVGAVLLIVTGITRLGFEALLNLDRPPVPGLILNVLIYFLLGLVLLGQVRYLSLRRQWHARDVQVSENLARRWMRYSLVFLSLAALVAFLLPTGYTVGLLDVAANVLGALALVGRFVMELILFVLTLPIWLLTLLLSRGEVPPLRQPSLIQPQPSLTPETAGGPSWLEVLRSLLFWAVALGVLVYVLRAYLRDHPEILRLLLSLGPIRALHGLLAAVWRWLRGVAVAVGERVPRRLSLRRRIGARPSRQPFPFFRLGTLSPRERTLYYYLSILRRAGQVGFPRRRSQTPYEYDDTLKPHLEQARQAMGMLTEDFVEARYSAHPIDRERERLVRTRWKRVKAAVKALSRREQHTTFARSESGPR